MPFGCLVGAVKDPRPCPVPLSLPGLALWLRADAGVLNGSALPAVDTNPVGTWQDQSGLGNHATQATTAKMPTWHSAGPSLIFDGVDDFMLLTSAAVVSEYFAVFRSTVTPFKDYGGVLEYAGTNDSAQYMGVMGGGVTQFTPSLPRFVRRDRTDLSGSFDLAPVNVRMLLSLGTNNPTSSRAMQLSGLSQSFYQSLEICEVVAYSADLATADRDAVESYLRGKWATP